MSDMAGFPFGYTKAFGPRKYAFRRTATISYYNLMTKAVAAFFTFVSVICQIDASLVRICGMWVRTKLAGATVPKTI
jgi:hypothetical protein